jgi:FixJ family two-component response regulator
LAHSSPTVFVIDDDISVRESLASLIQNDGMDVQIFSSAEEFLSHPKVDTPSCLVLDITRPHVDGLELQGRINETCGSMPIIFISGFEDVATTVQAMKAGAVEFLTKPFDDESLLSAIRIAIERSQIHFRKSQELAAVNDCFSSLSRREKQVMARVVSGKLNKQIAYDLNISEITVKAHRGRVMQKMKAKSLPDLVKMAAILGDHLLSEI